MATAMAITPGFNIFRKGLGIPLLVVLLLSMMILPIPPFMLDLLFTFNITLSLVILLASVYTKKPLDFAIFPTLLLVTTLLRLALNIASTRVVLLHGHTGTGAAGHVIESFGQVVVGGNYAVGLVVFAILLIINFVVVTKGAGRISEVTARFTLDAMPGKQMAIDADLNAGLLTSDEAKKRRQEIREEADFYGSMDGASKFVRGDAIAGVLILFINLVGGLIIGMVQHGISFSDAMHNYALLTIGDGLVGQIPALLLSTAAAMIVTRVSSDDDIGNAVVSQLFADRRSLYITSAVMFLLGIIPGMPHLAFMGFSLLIGGYAYFGYQHKVRETAKVQIKQEAELQRKLAEQQTVVQEQKKELGWDDVGVIDVLGLEVGYRLIPLVDTQQGGKLMERIKGVRKKLSQELGFLVPAVHIRDNLDLQPNYYRITLMGVTVSQIEVLVDRYMAINPGQVFGQVDGIPTKDPAFGLEALWIGPEQRDYAQSLGYTVVDPSTVIATHISHLMQEHACDLLGHEEVQQLIERLKQVAPKLVEELTPENVPMSLLVRVLQNLLKEHIPIRDFRSIIETLIEHAPRNREPDVLTGLVRVALNRLIVQTINGIDNELSVITLTPELEQILQNALQIGGVEGAGLEPQLVDKLQKALQQLVQRQEMEGKSPVLLVPPGLRPLLARFVRYSVPNLHVLSYHEVPDDKQLRVVGSVGQ